MRTAGRARAPEGLRWKHRPSVATGRGVVQPGAPLSGTPASGHEPVNQVKLVGELNEWEAPAAVAAEASWHAKCKDSTRIFLGGLS